MQIKVHNVVLYRHTLSVHNVALYQLGGAQDGFACSLWTTCPNVVRACTDHLAVLGNTIATTVTAIVCICATTLFITLSQTTVD